MSEKEQVTPDYTAMDAVQLLEACGDNAATWAAAFCQHAKKLGHEYDEGWMITWFANAIERSWQKRIERVEPATRPISEYQGGPRSSPGYGSGDGNWR